MFKTADTTKWSEYLIWRNNKMAKSLFEELGCKYERQGDYLIPCLTVPVKKEQPIGGRFNNIRACAREIVNEEITFA